MNAKDLNGQTALMMAAKEGHTEVVKVLLAGADVDIQDKYGDTALMIAALESHTDAMIAIFSELSTQAFRDQFNLRNIYGETLLVFFVSFQIKTITIIGIR